jgi:hypothetical protein
MAVFSIDFPRGLPDVHRRRREPDLNLGAPAIWATGKGQKARAVCLVVLHSRMKESSRVLVCPRERR